MKKHLIVGIATAVVLLLSGLPSQAVEDGEIVASELVKEITFGIACNGGYVTAPGGLVVECPASGGPRCATDEECQCAAILNPHGGYDSENICKKKP